MKYACMMRYACTECDWRGPKDAILKAPNPFAQQEILWGCPNCHSVQDMREICMQEGCENEATCGTPTPDGYKRLCGEHYAAILPMPLIDRRGE